MNLRERLQLRALINLIITIIEKLANILVKLAPKTKPDIPPPDDVPSPRRPRPLKKVIDTIDNVIPLPWRKK